MGGFPRKRESIVRSCHRCDEAMDLPCLTAGMTWIRFAWMIHPDTALVQPCPRHAAMLRRDLIAAISLSVRLTNRNIAMGLVCRPLHFTLRSLSAFIASALIAACGGGGGSNNANVPPQNSQLAFTQTATGLTEPLLVTHAGDGSNRLFIVERGGAIKILKNGAMLPDAVPRSRLAHHRQRWRTRPTRARLLPQLRDEWRVLCELLSRSRRLDGSSALSRV